MFKAIKLLSALAVLLTSAFSITGLAQSFVSVSVDTAVIKGTAGKVIFDFTNNSPDNGNNVQILSFSAPGATLGLPETEGGLVSGNLILGLNPANFTIIDSDFFFNELSVNFVKFSNKVTFNLQVSEVGPPVGVPPAQFAFFILDSAGSVLFSTLDPLGANSLFTIDVTGNAGDILNTFGPAVFIAPNSISVSVPAQDTVPPVSVASISPAANAVGWNNTNVVVTVNSTDSEPIGSGVKEIDFNLTGAQTSSGVVAGNTATITISAEGTTILTFFGIDNAGNKELPKAITVKIDKSPPVIFGLPGADCNLFPPNHKLVDVGTISAIDALSGLSTFNVTGVSNESSGSGESDIVISGSNLDPRNVQLRAERLGFGSGRMYTLTATATDVAGNTATSTGTCVVPHDQGQQN